jgi:hypothetical protein
MFMLKYKYFDWKKLRVPNRIYKQNDDESDSKSL